jgi:hypothetical protein
MQVPARLGSEAGEGTEVNAYWEIEDVIEAENGREATVWVHKLQSGYRYRVTFDGGQPHAVCGGKQGMAHAKALALRVATRGWVTNETERSR